MHTYWTGFSLETSSVPKIVLIIRVIYGISLEHSIGVIGLWLAETLNSPTRWLNIGQILQKMVYLHLIITDWIGSHLQQKNAISCYLETTATKWFRSRKPLNNSASVGQRIFCPAGAVYNPLQALGADERKTDRGRHPHVCRRLRNRISQFRKIKTGSPSLVPQHRLGLPVQRSVRKS